MSFILDALKKSESDRQRHSGPALYEAKVAAPRSQLPVWAIALAVLLGINLIIVAWALLKRTSHAEPTNSMAPVTAVGPAAVATGVNVAPAAVAPATAVLPAPVQAPSAPPTTVVTGSLSQAPAAPTAGQPGGAASSQAAANAAGLESSVTGAARADATQQLNPDDYAPATEAPPATGFHARQGTASGVPLYSQVATGEGTPLPQLRLDLHAYAAKPEDRFVLINMKKLREGDSLPEGVKVESITPDGVVLSHDGRRFLLPRD